MRIGFDVSPLHRPHPPGVVRATRGLVEALERRNAITIVRLEPPTGAGLLSWRQRDLADACTKLDLAGIHSPVSAFAWLGDGLRVHTVHELPWRHGVVENGGMRHRFWATYGARRAACTIVPSEIVARDLAAQSEIELEHAGDRGRIRVVPWGLDEAFERDPREPPSPRWKDCVLVPGGGRAKKNATVALEALKTMPDERRPRVVITGVVERRDRDRLSGRARALGVLHKLELPGVLDDAELADAYRSARAVLVLSRSEGFAFPVLEAMAFGTPVVVARPSVQAELAGPAGLAVDADDPAQVAAAIACASDRALFAHALAARAAWFTWDRAAELVERAWWELAS